MRKVLRALQALFKPYCQIVDAKTHRANEEERASLRRKVAQLESDLANNPTEVAKQKALLAVVAKMRESLDLEVIFQSTATEVRQLLAADRVGIYRFEPNESWHLGTFISEDVCPPYSSILGIQIRDDCFAQEYGIYYQQGRIWVVEDFKQVEMSDCHHSIVDRLGLQANVVVPLLKGDRLWGLLTAHQCSSPRQWTHSEIEFVGHIALHLSVAVQQTESIQQVQNQSEQLAIAVANAVQREQTVAAAIDKIRRSLDIDTIFTTTTQEVRQLLKVDRVAIYRFYPNWSGEFIFESVAEGWNPLIGPDIKTVWEDTYLQETEGGRYRNRETFTFAVEDIYAAGLTDCHREILEQFQAKAFCVVPVFVRDELWGLLGAYQNSAPRFWEPEEIDLLVQVGNQFGVAVRQSASIVKLQFKSEQLAASVEREKAVAAIIDKIRRTLDLDQIFTTTVQEVRQLLKADRVALYRFNPDWSGEFVVESVADGWNSLVRSQWQQPELRENISDCSLQDVITSPFTDTYFQETAGREFKPGQVFRVCHDIYGAGFSDCYIQMLERYQAKAYTIAALYQGQKLWGLLAAFQNSAPRWWQEAEINFLVQIGAQLGVALQQTQLLAATEQRKEELQTALTAQLQQRAAELTQEAEREKALNLVIEKIRQTLDLNTIFQTTATEVRQLLSTDRVAVFRFSANSGYTDAECVATDAECVATDAECVAEDVAPQFMSALREKVGDRCFGEKLATHYQQRRVWTLDDVESAELQECYRVLLARFQVRAHMIVPLLKNEALWGLLCIHQCSGPRHWQDVESEFVSKIAVNLGVALQQAELLAQTQQRSLELHTTLADLNAIVDNLADGLLVTDILGKITRFNPALLEMFGLEKIDLKGQMLARYFPIELAALVKEAERQEQEVVTAEVKLGSDRVGQALATSILKEAEAEEGEQCLGSVILIRDVTLEREVDRMKTDFLATVSHELRTPLTSILGFASIIEDKLAATVFPAVHVRNSRTSKALTTVGTNLEIIISEAERLTSLINDVLDISKMEAGRVDWNIETVEPKTILEQAIAATSSLFEAKELQLIKDFAPNLPKIQGDSNRIMQVLINLLSNAVKFTSQGSVMCRAMVRERNLLVSIRDTGIGIASSDLEKIFERFGQVGDVLTDKPKGTGLGLPICKQIIEHHGGTIWVESQLGSGSNFCFTLPLDSGIITH